jgi:O-antigen ligase
LDWALSILLFALPSYLIRFSIFGYPSTLLEGMIIIAFGVWFFKEKKYQKLLDWKRSSLSTPYPFGKELIILIIVSYLAVLVSGLNNSALGIWKAYFFEPALVFILLFNVFKGEMIKKIIWPLAGAALLISLVAIFQKITGLLIFNDFWAQADQRRVVSIFGYPNAVALYLGPVIWLLIGYALTTKKELNWFKVLLLVISALSLLAIIFASSKGAILAFFLSLTTLLFIILKKFKLFLISGLIIILAMVCFYLPLQKIVVEKIEYSESWQIRKLQWQETWNMIRDGRLLSGAGLANYQNSILAYHSEGMFFNKDKDPDFRRKIVIFNEEYKKKYWQPLEVYLYPHNFILNFWSELGLLGVLSFIWLFVGYFYLAIKLVKEMIKEGDNNKFMVLGLIGAMLMIVFHGLVDVPYFKNDLAILFWLLVASLGCFLINKKADIKIKL